ncbi:hypothetical protein Clacol_010093 [Clathrus columnatus]|uniref:Autophagy-related protein 14 n=1 Tax=Clathrus columnatus TaxID=1419009 RepID=A0AAV5ASV0_9AGAM|nr:hypothetical protein Clacol_010093 [Clathrus columnatus]
MEVSRHNRAELASLEERVAELRKETQKIRDAYSLARERVTKLRVSTAERRKNLAAAKALPVASHSQSVQYFQQGMEDMSDMLTHTRKVLVEELLNVFDIAEVGGRPSLGGTRGMKGEMTIGGLVLPVPGDMRRYSPDHINGAITHTLHFLGLLTFYLGVKLPFEVTWSGDAMGVGIPYITAGKGSELGGWARWSIKQPLHIVPSPSTPSTTGPTPTSSSSSQTPSFLTALTMLLYNTLYLCHTQSLNIPLSQSGEILRNLMNLCCALEVGQKSHQTGFGIALEHPTPPSFALDFTQLLQITSSGPIQRKPLVTPNLPLRPSDADDEVDGWDIIEVDF